MNHTSSESTLMTCSKDVYRWKKASRSSNDATHHHMEDIMVHSALIQRSSKVDSFGQPCMKIQRTSSRGVERVRGTRISIEETPCHSQTTSRLNFSMYGELTIWDRFRSRRTVNISWWQLTMSPSRLKPCHVEQLMLRTPKRCLKKQYFCDSEFQ